MSPLFVEGDYVLSLSKRFSRPKLQDCIVFEDDIYGCIVKRIVRKQKGGFYVEGTNASSMDSRSLGLIPFDKIIGKVVMRIPAKPKIKKWCTSRRVNFTLLIEKRATRIFRLLFVLPLGNLQIPKNWLSKGIVAKLITRI